MTDKKIRFIIYLCFFLSGIAGLIYESLWARYLSLIFGHTAYANALVLATFMGGLALGSFLLGKLADKASDRLYLYAWVEIGIAVLCIATPNFFGYSKDFYLSVVRGFNLSATSVVILKFLIGAIIMLPPTILMGGTFPILNKFFIRSISNRGNVIARLYYINSFGAVVGSLLAGFFLIRMAGLAFSVNIAALINFGVGLTALTIAKMRTADASKGQTASADPDDIAEPEDKEEVYPASVLMISLTAIFLSGFAAMLYEIVWIRFLSIILGSSTYSFSLMLAAFIAGITIGSYIISKKMPRAGRTFMAFGLCEIGIGLSLLLALPFYEKLPYLFVRLSWLFARKPENFIFYEFSQFLSLFIVMLLPTILLGMSFPLVCKIASSRYKFLGRSIGNVMAINTVGNVFGALATGLFLMQFMGLKRVFELGVIVNLLIGIVVIFKDNVLPTQKKVFAAALCCAAFFGYALMMPNWDKNSFSAQIFRHAISPSQYRERVSYLKANSKVLFYEDGLNDSVLVTKDLMSDNIFLFTNGKADASTGIDMSTQILLADIPLILKPDSKDVFVIGWGSGVTCGSALQHPIRRLDVAEISSSVIRADRFFREVNHNAMKDPRLHLYVEDAKTLLERTDKKYDIIISEPSNPWIKGIAGLFSIEYFKCCKDHLNEDGIMVQWLQAYESDDNTFEMIVRTLRTVFPEVSIWNAGANDVLLIGSNKKIEPDIKKSSERIALASVREDIARVKVNDLFTFFSMQIVSGDGVRNLIDLEGPVNSDYFPVLEYQAPVNLFTGVSVNTTGFIDNIDERRGALDKSGLFLAAYLNNKKVASDEYRHMYNFIVNNKISYNMTLASALAEKWHAEYPSDNEGVIAYAQFNIENINNGIKEFEKVIGQDKSFATLKRYCDLLVSRYNIMRSFLMPEIAAITIEKLGSCIDMSEEKTKPFFYDRLAWVYLKEKDYKKSIDNYLKAYALIHTRKDAALNEIDRQELICDISFASLKYGDFIGALAYAKKAFSMDSNNIRAATLYIKAKAKEK